MRTKVLVIATAIALLGPVTTVPTLLIAQTPAAAKATDLKTVLFEWANHMGMLRGVQQVESMATVEYLGTGSINVGGQQCKLTNYRALINYQTPGARIIFACTLPNGQTHQDIHVVSGKYAWNESTVGAGLVPGDGRATPATDAVNDRLIQLWSGPQGAVKAARAGGANTKVAIEGGKTVVTFPIPGVAGAIAKAVLSANYQAERVETRLGNAVTEFIYSDYADFNDANERLDAFFAGRIIEKRGGGTVLDLTVNRTNTGNLFVIMPVPPNVQKAAPGKS